MLRPGQAPPEQGPPGNQRDAVCSSKRWHLSWPTNGGHSWPGGRRPAGEKRCVALDRFCLLSGTGPLVVIFSFIRWNITKLWPPYKIQAGLEASPAGGGGWAGARETQTLAPHRASSVGIGAQGGASACAGSSLARDIVRCLMIRVRVAFNSAGAQCARDWARRALAPTPGAFRPHAP